MTDIYTVAVQKGGTGKTTTAAALAQAAAHEGKKTLAIDLDPQGNLTFALAGDPEHGGSYEVLNGQPAADAIQTTPQGIDLIPASADLATITSGKGTARRLAKALDAIQGNYDFIIIDTPPTAGELQYNALQAADGLIIPLQADAYNIQSLKQITATAQQIQKSNPALKFAGIIITQFDKRPTINRQLAAMLEGAAKALDIPYLGAVRKGIATAEAAALQRSLFEYAPGSKPAADYLEIYNRIITGEV